MPRASPAPLPGGPVPDIETPVHGPWLSWPMQALRGVLALTCGALALAWPGVTLLVLVLLFAAYALTSGVVEVAYGLRRHPLSGHRAWVLLPGLAGVVLGVLALLYPGLTLLVLALLVAVKAIVTGAVELAFGLRVRPAASGDGLLIATGVLSILFGVLVFIVPLAGVLFLVWMVGLYLLATGVLLLVLAWRLRTRAHRSGAPVDGARGYA